MEKPRKGDELLYLPNVYVSAFMPYLATLPLP